MKKAMIKVMTIIIAILLIPSAALSEVTAQQLDNLSDADIQILRISIILALDGKEDGTVRKLYSYQLDTDLMKLSLEELEWIKEYIDGDDSSIVEEQPPIYEKYGIAIVEYPCDFGNDKSACFSLYNVVADICKMLGCTVQNHNPEVSLNAESNDLSFAHFYLTYYADCSEQEAKEVVEEYTDVLIAALLASYPDNNFESLDFSWKIPAINADSLYAADYWCEQADGEMCRGQGAGLMYK